MTRIVNTAIIGRGITRTEIRLIARVTVMGIPRAGRKAGMVQVETMPIASIVRIGIRTTKRGNIHATPSVTTMTIASQVTEESIAPAALISIAPIMRDAGIMPVGGSTRGTGTNISQDGHWTLTREQRQKVAG